MSKFILQQQTTSVDELLQTFYSLSRQKKNSQNQMFNSFKRHFQKLNGAKCFHTGKFQYYYLNPTSQNKI